MEMEKYVKEICCDDCNHVGGYETSGPYGAFFPLECCPDCGGELNEQVGRWRYEEEEVKKTGFFSRSPCRKMTFIKGRDSKFEFNRQ